MNFVDLITRDVIRHPFAASRDGSRALSHRVLDRRVRLFGLLQ